MKFQVKSLTDGLLIVIIQILLVMMKVQVANFYKSYPSEDVGLKAASESAFNVAIKYIEMYTVSK